MENDSPNLFDSEPVTVQLTVPENTAHDDDDRDNVLTEILHGVRDDGVPDERDTTDEVRNNAVVEYHTDDDGDGDGDGDGDEGAWVDENVDLNDRSAADQELNDDDDDDRPADRLTETDKTHGTKARDVHKGLPPGRVKLIMKMDPDVNIVAADAVYILTKATESFVGLLAQHCHKAMVASNKKTLKKKHIEAVIEENVAFEFLEDTLDW